MSAAADHTGAWYCISVTAAGGTTSASAGVTGPERGAPPEAAPYGLLKPTRVTRVVLLTAYRDHDPINNDASNLATLCQRCHILRDREEHLGRRHLQWRRRSVLGSFGRRGNRHGSTLAGATRALLAVGHGRELDTVRWSPVRNCTLFGIIVGSERQNLLRRGQATAH